MRTKKYQKLKIQKKLHFQKIQKELADEQAQLEQMCSQFITKDNKITDSVIEDTKGANAAANQRKREIASLFSEVQKT